MFREIEIFKPPYSGQKSPGSNGDLILEMQGSKSSEKKIMNKFISEISEAASHQELDINTSSMI
jgi:hypothetical protein